MPNPNSAHTNVYLTKFSKKLDQPSLIWDKVLPRVKVEKDDGKWPIMGEERFKLYQTKVANKAPTLEVDWTYSSDTYSCDEHGLNFAISDKDVRNTDSVITLQRDGLEDLDEKIMLSIEYEVAAMLIDETILTNYMEMDANGTYNCDGKWDNPGDANSKPLKAFKKGIRVIWSKILRPPNTLILPFDVADFLSEHPDLERMMLEYDPKGMLQEGVLPPKILGMNVLYALGAYDSAKEGQARTAFTSVWGKNAIMAYVHPRPGLKKVTLGISPDVGGKVVRQWREEKRYCDIVEQREKGIDHVIVEAGCAWLMQDVIS
jgi:hypothetical protein